LRVGFVGNLPEPVGGAEIFLEGLIASLGDRVEAIALARWQRQEFQYERKRTEVIYRDARVVERDETKNLSTFYVYRHMRKLKPLGVLLWGPFFEGVRTAGFFLRERVNIVHCHLLYPNIFFAYIAARLLGIPVVVTVHGLIDLDAMGGTFIRRALMGYILRRCDRVIAVSEEIRRRCLAWGVKQVEMRSCGIDTGFFTPEPMSEQGLLFIGNLTNSKGFDILAEAYEDIRAATGEPLLLAGKNPEKLSVTEDRGIRYLGTLTPDELREAIRRCKLLVLPSRSEGTPLSVLEALSCNKLVLTSRVGDLQNLITDRENGFLMENLDAATLSARAIDILEHHERYTEEIGARPRETALRFDIGRIAAWHRSLYSHLVWHGQRDEAGARKRRRSVKRDFVLPILVRLDGFAPLGALFRWAYRACAALIARSLRGPGVKFIFLRRGIAKQEFMPFLSDVDLTVIVDEETSKPDVEAKLRRLAEHIPIMEALSPVVTMEEFRSWSDQSRFTRHRSFLFRLVEARRSWVALYEDGTANPLDAIRSLSGPEVMAAVLSEAMFWHAIVAREYSHWVLSPRLPQDAFTLKRYSWIMLKATAELWNLCGALRDHEALLFSRREVIMTASRDEDSARWTAFLGQSSALLDNRLGLRDTLTYIDEAHAFLSTLYARFEPVMRGLLEGETERARELRRLCVPRPVKAPPDLEPIELEGLPRLSGDLDPGIVAVLAAPRPIEGFDSKVVIVIVLRSLEAPPLTSIDAVRDQVYEHLEGQGVGRDEIDALLVDYEANRCFGIPGGLAPTARVLLERRAIDVASITNQITGLAPSQFGQTEEAGTKGGVA
jgi:glycosyltransferase involved in cell wall biosynthesis/predicted nucleotidyltransferase